MNYIEEELVETIRSGLTNKLPEMMFFSPIEIPLVIEP